MIFNHYCFKAQELHQNLLICQELRHDSSVLDDQTQFVDPSSGLTENLPCFQNRRSESAATFFRGERYFTVGHEWFVSVREGTDLGPFLHRGEAELAVALHVAEHCLRSPGGTAELSSHSEASVTEFELMVQEMLGCLEQRQLCSEDRAYSWTKQRIDALRKHPAQQRHTIARITALEYLLYTLRD